MQKPEYIIHKAHKIPELKGLWDGPVWRQADTLDVNQFHSESASHRPVTKAKLLYDNNAIYAIFLVKDRFVRCLHTNYQDMVCKDSCVEMFIQPKINKGYINFEINCGGTPHCSYIENPERTPEGFKKYTHIPKKWGNQVKIYHSLPRIVDPEIADGI